MHTCAHTTTPLHIREGICLRWKQATGQALPVNSDYSKLSTPARMRACAFGLFIFARKLYGCKPLCLLTRTPASSFLRGTLHPPIRKIIKYSHFHRCLCLEKQISVTSIRCLGNGFPRRACFGLLPCFLDNVSHIENTATCSAYRITVRNNVNR